jgi:hypothetical protein
VTGASARLAVVLAAAALASGCSFDRRSHQFACDMPTDCDDEHICDQGWCVPIGGDDDAAPQADADPNAPDAGTADAFVCPPGCTSCDIEGVCNITCATAGSCSAAPVVCPANVPCKVECNGDSSCAMGIDCSAAESCRIECTNSNSCGGPITCALDGYCRVECEGLNSCTGGIDCDQSCACDTFCTGSGSCTIEPLCPGPSQCTGGPCSSLQGQCNSC